MKGIPHLQTQLNFLNSTSSCRLSYPQKAIKSSLNHVKALTHKMENFQRFLLLVSLHLEVSPNRDLFPFNTVEHLSCSSVTLSILFWPVYSFIQNDTASHGLLYVLYQSIHARLIHPQLYIRSSDNVYVPAAPSMIIIMTKRIVLK